MRERKRERNPLAPILPRPDSSPMSPGEHERRYSEAGFAVILRLASQGPGGPDLPPPRTGLTLSQIQEIAGEVGIDPRRVARAAALLPFEGEPTLIRLVGGRARYRLERVIPAAVPVGELGRVVDRARGLLGTQGESREVLGGVEWAGSEGSASVSVSIMPQGRETALQASLDRTGSMTGIYAGVGLSATVALAVTLGRAVFGETGPGIAAAFLSSLPPGMLLARTLWKRSTEKWRSRFVHLMDTLAEEAETVAERGGGAPGDQRRPLPPRRDPRAET
jgi:hypothetical protein